LEPPRILALNIKIPQMNYLETKCGPLLSILCI